MICSRSHSKQVAEQNFEAGLSAPTSVQWRINQDPYASCLVISAENKHPRIKCYQNKAGGNQERLEPGTTLPHGWVELCVLQSTWVWGVELYIESLFLVALLVMECEAVTLAVLHSSPAPSDCREQRSADHEVRHGAPWAGVEETVQQTSEAAWSPPRCNPYWPPSRKEKWGLPGKQRSSVWEGYLAYFCCPPPPKVRAWRSLP